MFVLYLRYSGVFVAGWADLIELNLFNHRMCNSKGHFCVMSSVYPAFKSLHFEYDFLFCVFNGGIFHVISQARFVWFIFKVCDIILTAFLVEISTMIDRLDPVQ